MTSLIPLSMPLKIYHTQGWPLSEIEAVMSKTSAKLMDIMSVKISVLSKEKLPGGHGAETVEIRVDKPDHLWKLLKMHEWKPPAKLWFVEKLIDCDGSTSRGVTPNIISEKGVISGVIVIGREAHLDRNKKLDIHDCALTVAHEIGELLGLGHECDKLDPGLMCTKEQHGLHPRFRLNATQVNKARESSFLSKGKRIGNPVPAARGGK